MKTLIRAALAAGLAVSYAAPLSATGLDSTDPVVASFYRDLDRESTRGGSARVGGEQDRLPAIFRAALNADDLVVASFYRDINRELARASGTEVVAPEQDRLPEMVRAALEAHMGSQRGEQVVARRD